ncbi:preprotein translocase subunit SecB [Actinobacillus equuli]|nr:preprotein translocase subunit SecB [Actinobacillus equuli]
MAEENQVAAQEEQLPFELQIQRIYIKDVSFEAPNLPTIFIKSGNRN